MRIFVLVVLVVLGIGELPAQITLQYKFKTGDEFEYVQRSKQNAVQILPGMGEMKMDGALGGTMQLKIKGVDEKGTARIEAQYSKLKMVTNSFIMSMSMDSEGAQEEDGNKIMKAMTGKPFFFSLTKTGKVESVEGVENLYSGLGSLDLNTDVISKAQKTLKQTINDKSIKTLLENGLVSYPEHAVRSGDSWNTSSVQAVNFPMTIENTWTMKSSESTTAVVTCQGDLKTIDKERVNNLVNGMKSKSDLNGTQTMNANVDVKSGWPKE